MEVHLYQDLLTLNWNMLFSFITVVVLVLILKKYFFEKVYNFMEERRKEVENTLREAEETSQKAEEMLAEYKSQISGAEEEKNEIIRGAVAEAKAQADALVKQAYVQADQVKEKARVEIEHERTVARKELQKEVGELAMLAAGKILEKELDADKHKDVISKILDEAEETAWKE